MYIIRIILDGFKSYGVRTDITGIDPESNCIAGHGGSGMSNVLEAIAFVLGASNLSQARG